MKLFIIAVLFYASGIAESWALANLAENGTALVMQEGRRRLSAASLQNHGKNCWRHCNRRGGYCSSYCGAGNACCRQNWNADPAECNGVSYGAYTSYHTCVSPGQRTCTTVTVGSNAPHATAKPKSVTVPGLQSYETCPSLVNKKNWLGTATYKDTFNVAVHGTKVTVTRINSRHTGWGMNLKFQCCGHQPPADGIKICEHKLSNQGGGKCCTLGAGNHDHNVLKGGNCPGNDKISGAKVDAGCTAEVFQHSRFRGNSYTLVGPGVFAQPADFPNDQISSIKVTCQSGGGGMVLPVPSTTTTTYPNVYDDTDAAGYELMNGPTIKLKDYLVNLQVDADWSDQGWGNQKGLARVRLMRNGKAVIGADLFGVTPQKMTSVSVTFDATSTLAILSMPGDELEFSYTVGAHGGHIMKINSFQAMTTTGSQTQSTLPQLFLNGPDMDFCPPGSAPITTQADCKPGFTTLGISYNASWDTKTCSTKNIFLGTEVCHVAHLNGNTLGRFFECHGFHAQWLCAGCKHFTDKIAYCDLFWVPNGACTSSMRDQCQETCCIQNVLKG